MLQRSTMAMLLGLLLLVPARADEPTVDPLTDVVGRIITEARQAWEDDKDWPQALSKTTQQRIDAIPTEQRIAALARKLDANPAVDGYIKQQLVPDQLEITQDNRQQVHGALQVLPQVINQPAPVTPQRISNNRRYEGYGWILIGSQRPFVSDLNPVVANGVVAYDPVISTLTTGTLLEVKGIATVNRTIMMRMKTSSSDLIRLREFIGTANRANFHYRQALADALPAGAERLDVMLQDVDDRMRAHDDSYDLAMERFVAEARRISRSRDVSVPVRQALIAKLHHMSNYSDVQIRQIEIIDDKRFQIHRETIELNEDAVAEAVAYLSGREPEVAEDR